MHKEVTAAQYFLYFLSALVNAEPTSGIAVWDSSSHNMLKYRYILFACYSIFFQEKNKTLKKQTFHFDFLSSRSFLPPGECVHSQKISPLILVSPSSFLFAPSYFLFPSIFPRNLHKLNFAAFMRENSIAARTTTMLPPQRKGYSIEQGIRQRTALTTWYFQTNIIANKRKKLTALL